MNRGNLFQRIIYFLFGVPCEEENFDSHEDKVAYKLTKSDLEELVSDHQLDNYRLIGSLFEFRKPTDGIEFDQLGISQLYFDFTNFQFKRHPTNHDSHLFEFDHNYVHKINVNQGQSSYELDEDSIPVPAGGQDPINLFNQLDFYDRQEDPELKVDLVYFTYYQIDVLAKLYDDVVLSGCEIRYGRSFTDSTQPTGLSANAKIFSAKIEGKTPTNLNFCDDPIPIPNPDITDATTTDGPGIIYGHPCPPTWQTFMVTFCHLSEISQNIGTKVLPCHFNLLYRRWLRVIDPTT